MLVLEYLLAVGDSEINVPRYSVPPGTKDVLAEAASKVHLHKMSKDTSE